MYPTIPTSLRISLDFDSTFAHGHLPLLQQTWKNVSNFYFPPIMPYQGLRSGLKKWHRETRHGRWRNSFLGLNSRRKECADSAVCSVHSSRNISATLLIDRIADPICTASKRRTARLGRGRRTDAGKEERKPIGPIQFIYWLLAVEA